MYAQKQIYKGLKKVVIAFNQHKKEDKIILFLQEKDSKFPILIEDDDYISNIEDLVDIVGAPTESSASSNRAAATGETDDNGDGDDDGDEDDRDENEEDYE